MTLQQYVDSIKGKRIAVIGIGVSNTPLIELLCRNGCDVTACDRRSPEQMGAEKVRLESLGAKLRLGPRYLEGLDEDVIFRTPGLMPFEPHLEAAKKQGSLLTSEMEVFFSLCPCRVIAVTGSDGKTTTTTIISELLRAAGYRVHLGGNIGHPLLCEVPEIRETDFAVLELSSFQLHSMHCRPDVAVITNISPNHLDKHKDYQDYIDAKRAIYENQRPGDKLVLNYDDAHTPYYLSSAKGRVAYFSDRSQVDTGTVADGGMIYRVDGTAREPVMATEEIRLPGEHNLLNYLAAFEAVRGLVSPDICREVAMRFGGVAHRLEHVRELHGVTYINDSIGSSPTRTIAGLRALKSKPIVIAGGYDKHIAFDGLGDELCLRAKRVFLTGDTAQKIADAICASPHYDKSGLQVEMVSDFDAAVHAAAASARDGDIVLLSPACASFDHFKNFEERGERFKKLVMELV
ncbi:MAG: UDP-N-acetylmuramoyl-L-alanine--D-glutamate ligase [Oscillospiraceae bacterium]|nr:UDP-N-acetylmuramoyl-L-alanine--D-glutamate ligase [Oscillospiraceae bacterium]